MYTGQVYAPGTILQIMYLKERIRTWTQGKFLEVGPGQGYVSKLLLDSGWSGVAYDLNTESVDYLKQYLHPYTASNKYAIHQSDFLNVEIKEKYDLVISSMVLEHLSDVEVDKYMKASEKVLSDSGRIVFFLPSNVSAWGIEDKIAGHYRRYNKDLVFELARKYGFNVINFSGLTFPLSNILLPISNYLVSRAEGRKEALSMYENTVASGMRDVPFKTDFPMATKLILNEIAMYPLHLLQKAFRNYSGCLVLYVEMVR